MVTLVSILLWPEKKDNVWHIFGINGENKTKVIEIDLSFVTNVSGYVILEKEKGLQQEMISNAKKTKSLK